MKNVRQITFTFLLVAAAWIASSVQTAQAGCGCDKPPPVPATMRPRVTYAGSEVTFFGPDLNDGASYTVAFTSGTTKATATVTATAVTRRDLSDAVYKVQLPVTLPSMPLGPTAVTVSDGKRNLISISDADFTVAPDLVVVPANRTTSVTSGYRAAVSRSGIVYVSLDLTNVEDPLVVRAQLHGYPLLFSGEDAIFYNVQGFTMQVLGTSMPGLYTLAQAHSAADSDVLQYSRHEFNTYFLQHAERQPHAVDPTDPNWHMDGSRHVDHNHLILALTGSLANGNLPTPGAASANDLQITTFSLFSRGLVGVNGVTMQTLAFTTSYDSRTSKAGHSGDVLTGGTLSMSTLSQVDGNATAAKFTSGATTAISGGKVQSTAAVDSMPLLIPEGIGDLGPLTIAKGASRSLVGPVSYVTSVLRADDGSTLSIDNSAGPVTLYVTGSVTISDFSTVNIADLNPEKFAIYVIGSGPVKVSGSSTFAGVVYAPQAPVEVKNNGEFYGAFVGAQLTVAASSTVAYDVALRGPSGSAGGTIAAPSPTLTSAVMNTTLSTVGKTTLLLK